MRGFKSFASKTELQLEPGITCIVGPNGSGKSNIVDALAWVMGEMGAKTLRGAKMDDVIFAGSDGKTTALGRAEVSLTIDNSDGALPIEYTEVTIKRTMFRGGGSEYEINGNKCRLLDIQELLSDTGLGREMHVIVGQGRLDTILNATGQDRRGFIEEAAGVLKHRKRKEKAISKLNSMQDKLTRLADLSSEVRRQLGPLGRQANVARRANNIQSTVRDALSRILADDWVTLNHKQTASQKNIDAKKQECNQSETAINSLNQQVAKLEGQLTNKQLQQISEVVYEFNSLATRTEALINLSNERTRGLAESEQIYELKDISILFNNAQKAKQEQQALANSLQKLENLLDKKKLELDKCEVVAEQATQKVQIIRQSSSQRRENTAKTEVLIELTMEKLQDLVVRMQAEQTHTEELENNFKKLTNNQIIQQKKVTSNLKALQIAQDNEAKCQIEQQEASDAMLMEQQINQELSKKLSSIEATITALNQTLSQQLGQDVVLKSKRFTTPEITDELRKIETSMVKVKRKVGDNFVITSENTVANIIAERIPDFSVISTDGEILYHEHKNGEKIAITLLPDSINQQIEQAITEQKSINKDYVNSTKKAEQLQTKHQKTISEYEKISETVKHCQQSLTNSESQVAVIENNIKSISNEIERQNKIISNYQVQHNEESKRIEKLTHELSELTAQRDESSTTLHQAIDNVAKAEVNLNRIRTEYHELSTQVATKYSQTQNLLDRADELERQAQSEQEMQIVLEKQTQLRKQRAQQTEQISKAGAIILEELKQSAEVANRQKQSIAEQQTKSNDQLTKLRLDLRNQRQNFGNQSEQLHQLELANGELNSAMAVLTERIHFELAVEPKILAKEFDPSQPMLLPNPNDETNPIESTYNRQQQERRLKKAQGELNQLGKVNPLALEEFNALEERHKYLTDQIQDLEKARTDLLKLIGQIDERTINAFTSAFEDTAREFEQVFTTLFPGGKGSITLSDPNDLLNTGIEIHATPVGKRISRLSLLSGGERSLVAVALLVAIFKARPSPFYVMDEVEAALDDVNLSRLLNIFRQLKVSSQLLIVTHQKRTMEVADALYGITMRRDGITQVISQKMNT